jgi:hypothetical protein
MLTPIVPHPLANHRVAPGHAVGPDDAEFWLLDEVIADADFPCESNGLVFCDTLAADYPKDIDCYLRDGKDRLQAEMNNPTAIVSGKAVNGFHSAAATAGVDDVPAGVLEALNVKPMSDVADIGAQALEGADAAELAA